MGIVGPNGSGKSTLLKILSQVTKPSRGEIVIRGNVSSVLEAGAAFHPDLTCLDNIYLSGSVLGMTRIKISQKLEQIIEFSELKKFINTPVKKLSTGMNIRLAFAICVFLEGNIMIFDEVLAVADEKFRKKALNTLIKNSLKNNKTTLFVSHDIRNIKTFCNKVLILEKGKLLKYDLIEKILF